MRKQPKKLYNNVNLRNLKYYLKHNPKPAALQKQEDNEKTFKKTMKTGYMQPLYAQVTACGPRKRCLLKRPSLTNTNSKSNNKSIHMKNYDHQVHLLVSANREFPLHANHHNK